MSRASPRFHRSNPTLPAVGSTQGVMLYRIFGTLENQLTISGLHLLGPVNNPTLNQMNTLLGDLVANVFPSYAACISTDWACTVERLDVVHRNDIMGVQNVTHAGSSGTRLGGHLPTEVAAVILKNTFFKGQHGRGRMSLPGISPSDVTSSTITAAGEITALSNFAALFTAVRTDGTNGWAPCVAQRSNTAPKLIVAAAAITTVKVDRLLGTIRRRKIGRGK